MRLELGTIPVSDVDRAKAFYIEQAGFGVEQDVQVDDAHRFVELVPQGSPCSIALQAGYVRSAPGSLEGVQLNVDDIEEVHTYLRERGVDVSDVQDYRWGRFCFFSDPGDRVRPPHDAPAARRPVRQLGAGARPRATGERQRCRQPPGDSDR